MAKINKPRAPAPGEIAPADPFNDRCQICRRQIAKGVSYWTVAVQDKNAKWKEKHICTRCKDKHDIFGTAISSPNG
jgi:hypothetical protein